MTPLQPADAVIPHALPVSKPTDTRRIEVYRQCPICYHGDGGVGVAYCTQGDIRWYKCKLCGHSWKAFIRTQIIAIESRRIDLETR